MPNRPRIGITLGDPAGIGPEVVLRALRSGQLDRRFDYEVIGNPLTKRRADAVDWVVEGAKRCLAGELAALATAPITKELLHRAGYPFVGQTELLAHISHTKRFAMMLAGGPLRVALVTIHTPLRNVAKLITARKIGEVIGLSDQICRRFGIRRPRIAVAGLNPHAGEDGVLGQEDGALVAPAVAALKARGHDVRGPLSADTLFHEEARARYDAALCMYHDQALIPIKTLAFWEGVNVTLGLPIVRTSPDHGTAFDIAGTGKADSRSMVAAIRMAAAMADARAG